MNKRGFLEQASPPPLPNPPPLFPFLPIPYPFRRLLRRLEGFESGLFPLALVSAGGLVPDLGFRLVALLSEGADEVEDAAAPPADAVDDESA